MPSAGYAPKSAIESSGKMSEGGMADHGMVAVLSFFILALLIVLASGFPIAFGFLLINLVGILLFMGPMGLQQMTLQIFHPSRPSP